MLFWFDKLGWDCIFNVGSCATSVTALDLYPILSAFGGSGNIDEIVTYFVPFDSIQCVGIYVLGKVWNAIITFHIKWWHIFNEMCNFF